MTNTNNLITQALKGDRPVRVVTIEGEPWFVAADVCRALGMDTGAGTFKWLVGLSPDQRNTHRLEQGGRGNPNVTVISESGLYRLILRSDKPEAKPFQDWVCRDVLPSIRKHGGYIAGQEALGTGELSEEQIMARAMEMVHRKLARIEAERQSVRDAHALPMLPAPAG